MSDMEKQIEDHIITEAAKGDINAFEEIYKTYSRFVFNISLRVTCNYGDAQEVTQEAFMKIYNKLSSFSFKSSFKTWLYRIAVNTAINFIKKESRQREKVSKLALELKSSDYKDLTSNAIEKEAINSKVDKILKMLNPEQRACLVLKHIEGLSCQEISDVLQVNVNTIKTRLKRARESLLPLRKEVV